MSFLKNLFKDILILLKKHVIRFKHTCSMLQSRPKDNETPGVLLRNCSKRRLILVYHKKMCTTRKLKKCLFGILFIYIYALKMSYKIRWKWSELLYSWANDNFHFVVLGFCLLAPMCEGMVFCFTSFYFTRIYKFPRVSMKERKKERTKETKGKGSEREGQGEGTSKISLLTEGRRNLDTLWLKLLFFLNCCNTIYAFLHCLFKIFFFYLALRTHLASSCIVGRYF